MEVRAVGGPQDKAAGTRPVQAGLAQQASDAFGAMALAAGLQFDMDAWGPVTALVGGVDRANVDGQRDIDLGAGAGRGAPPSVVADAGDSEGRAERREGVVGLYRADPFVALWGGSERMPSVFFRMSRCSRTRWSSALRARFSAARSGRLGVASPK